MKHYKGWRYQIFPNPAGYLDAQIISPNGDKYILSHEELLYDSDSEEALIKEVEDCIDRLLS